MTKKFINIYDFENMTDVLFYIYTSVDKFDTYQFSISDSHKDNDNIAVFENEKLVSFILGAGFIDIIYANLCGQDLSFSELYLIVALCDDRYILNKSFIENVDIFHVFDTLVNFDKSMSCADIVGDILEYYKDKIDIFSTIVRNSNKKYLFIKVPVAWSSDCPNKSMAGNSNPFYKSFWCLNSFDSLKKMSKDYQIDLFGKPLVLLRAQEYKSYAYFIIKNLRCE